MNSRLPHKEPLIFIGQLLNQNKTQVTFETHFPLTPTLAMFCEAAAQGTSFFPLSPNCNTGVVSSFRNIKLLSKNDVLHFDTTVTLKHSYNDSYLFEFNASSTTSQNSVATGEIAVFYTSL
ncbi:MAG: hypothetical protein PHQ22_00075 [Sulfuricurvum sp.]|nr:hypothetical protein [Sulfuricurvum sp.]MDD5385573.1 hypothetical protein [Sulfuricurvum sp.]